MSEHDFKQADESEPAGGIDSAPAGGIAEPSGEDLLAPDAGGDVDALEPDTDDE